MSEDIEATGGLDRRDFIKRGAVVGGLVWAAPLVQSLGSPAFAQEGTVGGEEECDDFYNFKIEGNWAFVECTIGQGDEQCTPAHWEQGAGQCVTHVLYNGTTRTLTGSIGTHGTMTVVFSADGKVATISLPAGCDFLSGDAKAGSTQSGGGCFAFGPSGSVWTVNTGEHDISHIVGTICC